MTLSSCKKKSSPQKTTKPKSQKKEQPITKNDNHFNKKILSYEMPEFPLKNDIKKLEDCKECQKLVKNITNKLSQSTPKEKLNYRDTILKIYKQGDDKARLGAIRALYGFNLSEDWVDLIGEWLITEKNGKIRHELYLLLAKVGGKRAVTILNGAIRGEKDLIAFKGVAKAAYLLDLQGKSSILKQHFLKLRGKKASIVWLHLMKLSTKKNLAKYFAQCRDQLGPHAGKCVRALAFYKRQEDFLMLLGYLESRKLLDPYAISALSLYAKKQWFDNKKVMATCISIAKDPKIPLLSRETALGVIGELGSREELAPLLKLTQDKDLKDAAKRAQWRIRKRIGLPILEPLLPIKRQLFKNKKQNKGN